VTLHDGPAPATDADDALRKTRGSREPLEDREVAVARGQG
jgi:hypothetical protein